MYRNIAIAVAVGALVAAARRPARKAVAFRGRPTYTTGSHLPKRSGGGGASTV